MSPVSPVFHTVETVIIVLNSIRVNSLALEKKMSMLVGRALKFSLSILSKMDLQALYLSGTYCHKTVTRTI